MDVVSSKVIDEIFYGVSSEGQTLKAGMDENDKWLILLYFRWLTRKGARNLGISRLELTNQMTADSKQWLADHNMAGITDWEFTGVVDYGSDDLITCSRGGHRLRYAYYATSPSTGSELVFGKNCASEFFDIDPALLGHLTKTVDQAKLELRAAFNHGRLPQSLAMDSTVQMLQVLRREPAVAAACLKYLGQTALELWANFISRGLPLPRTLWTTIEFGYQQAIEDFVRGLDGGEAALACYRGVMQNERVAYSGSGLARNHGIFVRGDFIYPLTGCKLFDAVRVCMVEELMSPTPVSTYYDISKLWARVLELESLSQQYDTSRYSRAEVFIRALSPSLDKDITDPLSCLLVASAYNDLRFVTFFFGLQANSMDSQANEWADLFHLCWTSAMRGIGMFNNGKHLKRSLLICLFHDYIDRIISAFQSGWSAHCAYPKGIEVEGYSDNIFGVPIESEFGYESEPEFDEELEDFDEDYDADAEFDEDLEDDLDEPDEPDESEGAFDISSLTSMLFGEEGKSE